MRYRERTAVRSGGGTATMRPIGPCRSGGCAGGDAAPTAGRCWPFRSGKPALDVPPIVENLEASTGRAVSSALGLSQAGVADLDGDGLDDLWGEADGQLVHFRGETPELWRVHSVLWRGPRPFSMGRLPSFNRRPISMATGWPIRFSPAREAPFRTSLDAIASHAMGPFLDLGFSQHSEAAVEPPGSRTAIARSGRDGHMIWKTELDRGRLWYERDHGESYNLTTQSLAGRRPRRRRRARRVRAEVRPAARGAENQARGDLAAPGSLRPDRPAALVGRALAARVRGVWFLSDVLVSRSCRRTRRCPGCLRQAC